AAALDVEHSEQGFSVSDGNAQHGAGIRENAAQAAGRRILHQSAFSGTGHAAQDAGSQRNALARGMRRGAGLSLDLDFLGPIVEQADADVIESKILMNL